MFMFLAIEHMATTKERGGVVMVGVNKGVKAVAMAKVMAVAMTGIKLLGFRSPVVVYNELLLNRELAKSSTKH